MDNVVNVALRNRAFLYINSARVFSSELSKNALDMICSDHMRNECALFDDVEGRLTQACSRICGCLVIPASFIESSRSEYTKLFVGPESLPVPLWESVYVSGEPLLFQRSTLIVREAYAREGFRAAGYPHEPDDHVATELNFMAALSERALQAFEQGDFARYRSILCSQSRFLEEHLLLWIREFSDRLNAVDGISSFYPSFASLAALVCERDAEVIKELLAAA